MNKADCMSKAEVKLSNMEDEAVRMIKESRSNAARASWFYSHLGSIDFAREMGLITEPRRQELHRRFVETVNNKTDYFEMVAFA